MIRAAILGMTLGAGAASAQGMVPTGSLTRQCGGEVLTLAAAAPATAAEFELARDVVSLRVGGVYSALFNYAEIDGDQIVVSMPAGVGDVAALEPLLERVDFGLYPALMRFDTGAPPPLAEGRMVLPDQRDDTLSYVLMDEPILDGSAIASAEPMTNQNGTPAVSIRFTPEGTQIFADYTTAHIGEPFAIVLNGEVVSTPIVQAAIYGGTGMISGAFTTEETKALAAVLQGGILPFDLVVVARETLDGSDPSADFCP